MIKTSFCTIKTKTIFFAGVSALQSPTLQGAFPIQNLQPALQSAETTQNVTPTTQGKH